MKEEIKIIKIEDYLKKDGVVLKGEILDGEIFDFGKFKFKKGAKKIEREYFEGRYDIDFGD